MKHYHATVSPRTSLFLGRDRGNRAVRHSFHYVPASTIGGALNTHFYQLGRQDLMERFRFGNLYPATEADDGSTWMPAPRSLYYCPACRGGHLITGFGVAESLSERMCSRDGCQTMLRAEHGVVNGRERGDTFEINVDDRRRTPPTVDGQIIGRTALQRGTGTHVDGRLHQVEVLRVRGVPFRGDVWVEDGLAQVLKPGATFRLSIGGLRSRGCGRAELRIGTEIEGGASEHGLLLAETPVLPLPDDVFEDVPTVTTGVRTPYARIEADERWAAKPLHTGKGLVSFLNAVAVGSTLKRIDGGGGIRGDVMHFYSLRGSDLILYGFDRDACAIRGYSKDYSFAELWTLGYGRVRWLVTGTGHGV